jgi:hypothetical protein
MEEEDKMKRTNVKETEETVRKEKEGTEVEGTTTINIILSLYRPITCIVQKTVTPQNFSLSLLLQS